MEVRAATIADAAALADAGAALFEAPVDRLLLRRLLDAPGHLLVIAWEGERPIGQARAMLHRHPDRAPDLFVDSLSVAADRRRRGAGRALVDALLAWGRAEGCEAAWVGTEPDNAAANALYATLGRAAPGNIYLIEL